MEEHDYTVPVYSRPDVEAVSMMYDGTNVDAIIVFVAGYAGSDGVPVHAEYQPGPGTMLLTWADGTAIMHGTDRVVLCSPPSPNSSSMLVLTDAQFFALFTDDVMEPT